MSSKIVFDIPREELEHRIAVTRSYANTIDEYGDGHWNVILNLKEDKATYCGQRTPSELVERARNAFEEHYKLCFEIDKKAFPRTEEIVKKIGRSSWSPATLTNGALQGQISEEEFDKYLDSYQKLKEGEYAEPLKANAIETKQVQNDFIAFLESLL